MCAALTQGFEGTQEQLGLITGSLTSLLMRSLSLCAGNCRVMGSFKSFCASCSSLPVSSYGHIHEQIEPRFLLFIFGLLLKNTVDA